MSKIQGRLSCEDRWQTPAGVDQTRHLFNVAPWFSPGKEVLVSLSTFQTSCTSCTNCYMHCVFCIICMWLFGFLSSLRQAATSMLAVLVHCFGSRRDGTNNCNWLNPFSMSDDFSDRLWLCIMQVWRNNNTCFLARRRDKAVANTLWLNPSLFQCLTSTELTFKPRWHFEMKNKQIVTAINLGYIILLSFE